MSSKKNSSDWFDLDLERDMPLTPADLDALARSRRLRPVSAENYQRWVNQMTAGQPRPTPRLNSDSDDPFEL